MADARVYPDQTAIPSLIVDKSGTALGTAGNPLVTSGGGGGVASSVALNDNTTTTNHATIDGSGNLHTQETNSSAINTALGAIGDAAWGLSGNASEIAALKKIALLLNGLGLDNTNEQKVSLYGKVASAGDTPVLLDSSGRAILAPNQSVNIAQYNGANVGASNPQISQDQVRALIANGQGFSATTGLISSLTNTNLYGGMEILASNIAKNIFIFNVVLVNITISGDIRINQLTAQDAQLTNALTPLNLQPGNVTTSLATVTSSPNNFTVGGASINTGQVYQAANVANSTIYLLQNGMGYYLKATTTQGIAVYTKLPTAGQTFGLTINWLEF